MNRSDFLSLLTGGMLGMNSLKDLKKYTDNLGTESYKTPLLFIGHGSPMNGIEDNEFSDAWIKLGKEIKQPAAVIVISAHWLTKGTLITAMEKPKTIHDFYGFPKALFDVQYPSPGSPALASEAASLITKTHVELDHEWGLDHGTWSIIRRMYPEANIPVLQLSIDYSKPAQWHYELAQELNVLRKKGVLIVGSGNMVHNLRAMNWHAPDSAYDWAAEMNDKFKQHILDFNHKPLINYQSFGEAAMLSIPTPEHYFPLLYILGMQSKGDSLDFFNDKTVMGSISMTSVKIGSK